MVKDIHSLIYTIKITDQMEKKYPCVIIMKTIVTAVYLTY
jgi:hypothetical protein